MMSTCICRWLFLLTSLATWISFTNSKEMRVVCYYTNWSIYRHGAAKFSPQNINPYLCTHLIYAFGGFTKDNKLKPFDKYQDIEKGGYAKFTGLKTYNKNLKTMLAIGGWNEGSSRFSPLVANPDRRKELVKNAIKFLRLNHFDGLDLDWEYPSFRDGGKPRDRDNYAHLVKELREEFERESEKTGRSRLLLTMAVPAGIEYINKGYDVPKLTKYLDWMNILSYDYHSAFEPAVNHHAPLYSLEEDDEYNYDGELNIDFTIKHYLKLGAEPSKLVLGIPTYGRSYTLFNPDAFELGSPADGPGEMGEATKENGYLAYYEICDNVKNQDWEWEQPDPKAMGPYAFKDNQWVGYDDEKIVRKKAQYVADNSMGGIMFWAIDNDDFRGNCHGKPYPLIEAGKEALLNAYGITDENLISPPSKPVKSRTRTRTKASNRISTSDDENETKVEKLSKNSTRNRIRSKEREESQDSSSKGRRKIRRKGSNTAESSTYSSLKVVTPSYTTPAPPSTPDLDGAFKCEDEGFYPHPKDCKKYFWCLNGAGDSGIVAHQFTCPAGLYFNKAADSCDYTQNVLCNKKLQKTSSSATEPSTSEATVFSSSRVPPKITAATSKTTFRLTSTTEAYEDEYEYEDDDEEEGEGENHKVFRKNEPEEDPKVIKALIDLIKKAGGIEELERQLNLSKDNSSSSSSNSAAPISKSLYERVLSKAVKNTLTSNKNSYLNIRNSRGPQSEGLTNDDEKTSTRRKTERGKLQYTSILRNRPSTTESSDDEPKDETVKEGNEVTSSRKISDKSAQLEYVNIRRPKISTTTKKPENNRNKILGEGSLEGSDDEDATDKDEDDDEGGDDDEDEDEDENDGSRKKTFSPQYVNIKRQRPSTTDGPATSKYVEIRRGSTTESADEIPVEGDHTTSKYMTIRRGTTSPSTTVQGTSFSIQTRRGSTTPTTFSTANADETTKRYANFKRGSTTERSSSLDDSNTKSQTLENISATTETTVTASLDLQGSTNPTLESANELILNNETNNDPSNLTTTTESFSSVTNETVTDNNENIIETTELSKNITATEAKSPFIKRPQLFRPKPFTKSTPSTLAKPITESSTPASKVSQSNFKFRLRPKIDLQKEVGESENNPSVAQFRTRGSSRFKLNRNKNLGNLEQDEEDGRTTSNQSSRRILATEKSVDEARHYRPRELADFSSLTAVDFEKIKEFNFGRSTSRRRTRPTRTTTTEVPDGTLKTSNKQEETSSFAKTRRLLNGNKVRSFGTRTTREPASTTTREPSSTESIENPRITPRTRKIIRRFRTSTPATVLAEIEDSTSKPNSLSSLFNRKPVQLPFALQQNKVDEDLDDSFEDASTEEEENIKLSESNIRENSDVNSFRSDSKQRRTPVKAENLHEKTNIYEKNSANTKYATTEKKSSTEPNIIIRTRKIVRKITPTTETVAVVNKTVDLDQSFGRKRKIIRRLRPISEFNAVNSSGQNIRHDTNNTTIQNTTAGEDNNEFVKRLYRPTLKMSINKPRVSNDDQIELKSTKTDNESHNTTDFEGKYTIPKRLFRPKLSRNVYNKTSNIGSVNEDAQVSTGSKRVVTPILGSERGKLTYITVERGLKSAKGINNQKLHDVKENSEANQELRGKEVFSYVPSTTVKALTDHDNDDDVTGDVDDEEYDDSEDSEKTSEHSEADRDQSVTKSAFPVDINEQLTNSEHNATSDIKRVSEPTFTVDANNFRITTDESDIVNISNSDEPENIKTKSNETGTLEYNYSYISRSTLISTENNVTDTDENLSNNQNNLLLNSTTNKTLIDNGEIDDIVYVEQETEEQTDEVKTTTTTTMVSSSEADSESLPSTALTKSVETSSVRNIFRRPKDRPTFVRPKLTHTKPEKTTLRLPNYRTFSRTASSESSLNKKSVSTYTYIKNQSDDDGDTEETNKYVSKRYRYKNIERPSTTSFENIITTHTTDTSFNQNIADEEDLSEITTHTSELTTFGEELSTVENISDTNENVDKIANAIDYINVGNKTDNVHDSLKEFSKTFDDDDDINNNNETFAVISNAEVDIIDITTDNINEINDISDSGTENIRKVTSIIENVTENYNIANTEYVSSTTEVPPISDFEVVTTDVAVTDNIPINFTAEVYFTTENGTTEYINSENVEFTSSYDILDKDNDEVISSSDATSTLSLPEVAVSTENYIISTQGYSTDIQLPTNETSTIPSSTIPSKSTIPHQRSTLRPIALRPTFSTTKLKDLNLSQTTEATIPNFKQNRFNSRARFQTFTTESSLEDELLRPESVKSKTKPYSERSRSFKYRNGFKNKVVSPETTENDNIQNKGSTALPINKSLYKQRITQISPQTEDDDYENVEVGDSLFILSTPKSFNNTETKKINQPQFTKKPAIRIANQPKTFSKTTEVPKVNEELSDIDTKAVRNRNKNLFSKNRKMNIPFVGLPLIPTSDMSSTEESTDVSFSTNEDIISVTTEITPKSSETTESFTTLHHVFAEVSSDNMGTTEQIDYKIDIPKSKIERLIEVNRIVQVKTSEAKVKHHVMGEQKTDEVLPVLNKIGEINRVTVIKIVDPNGKEVNGTNYEAKQPDPISPVYIPTESTAETSSEKSPIKSSVDMIIQIAKVEEIPSLEAMDKVNLTSITMKINNTNLPESNREERKFEIYGGSKISNNHDKDQLEKAEIIDGISIINVITPRPLNPTEASTISLEGLFQYGNSIFNKKESPFNEELLETDQSKFVNVRVLQPDESVRLDKGIRDNTKVIPIKLLKQDDEEEVTMKAHVVEITPKSSIGTIKIIPIRVEMSKTIANNLPLLRIGKQNTPTT